MVTTGSENMLAVLERIAASLERIANKLDPPAGSIVGSPYVAEKLGCTTTYVSFLVRDGQIPASCIVPGTGKGRLWKFYRSRIEAWLAGR
jgi:hypothetical protein